MTRALALAIVAALVLASAAQAKGPHAMLSSEPREVEPGRPWEATLELNEFRRPSHVTLYARQGNRKVAASVRRVPAEWKGQARYRTRLTFPSEGRWRVYAATKARSFAFPAVAVGADRVPEDYVAFPEGSRAQREGAGGIMTVGPETAPTGSRAKPLPPEVVSIAARDEGEGSGVPSWLFPVAGVVLVGAGLLRARLR
jgi:hypothetical protein